MNQDNMISEEQVIHKIDISESLNEVLINVSNIYISILSLLLLLLLILLFNLSIKSIIFIMQRNLEIQIGD